MSRFKWQHVWYVTASWLLTLLIHVTTVHIKDLGHTVPDSAMRQSPYASNAQVCLFDLSR